MKPHTNSKPSIWNAATADDIIHNTHCRNTISIYYCKDIWMSSIRFAFRRWRRWEIATKTSEIATEKMMNNVHAYTTRSNLVMQCNAHICMYITDREDFRIHTPGMRWISVFVPFGFTCLHGIPQFRLLEPRTYLNKIFQFKWMRC